MVVASLGYIPPTVGALLQEGIDVAVILNALRAATGSGDTGGGVTAVPPPVPVSRQTAA